MITARASRRIARYAFDLARREKRKRVVAIHKANIMKLSDGLFLACARQTARHYPGIAHLLKVTIRGLLSHTAGLTIHGFPGYAAGQPIPTVAQVLDGKEPANTKPVRVDVLPGSQYRYSGGGYTVLQQLLADVTGKPCLLMGFSQPDENAHAPNEWLDLDNYHLGIKSAAYLYDEIARMAR